MKKKLVGLLSVLLVLFSFSDTYKSPLNGKWEAVDKHGGVTDTYLFTIKEKSQGSYTGVIESKMDGAMLPSMLISKITYDHPYFKFVVNTEEMVITYSGKMSDDFNQLVGHFEYSNPGISKKELTLTRKTPYVPEAPKYVYNRPVSNVFPTAAVEEVKLKKKEVENLIQKTISGEFGEINSFLLIKKNKLVIEEYFNGFTSSDLHQLQSITKSITSLLVGIAIDKGFIQSVDEKVINFFNGYEYAPGWEKISLRHLLTMSSGVQWIKPDPSSTWDKDEPISTMLMKPITGRTGLGFDYNSAMQVLAGVLEKATKLKLEKFAEQYLFNPLGISSYAWQLSQTDSIPLCTGSLKLRPIDMAKIGVLLLNKGKYNDNQIVSEKWVNESTEVQIEVPKNRGDHYGYLWWVKTTKPGCIYAHGLGSQFIFIIPESELVMVTTGNNMYNNKDNSPLRMLLDYSLCE